MAKKKPITDGFILGTLAGLAGCFGDFIIHHLAFFILKTSTTAHYISQLMFPREPVNAIHYLFGLGIHFMTGGLVGIILIELYRRYGDKYPYFKGISLGSAFWIVHVVVIPSIVNQPNLPYLHRSELEAVVDLIAHIVFGVCAAAVYQKLKREE